MCDACRYQIKAFAILLSSFKEVLYIDADNFPVVDPSVLFDLPLYQQHGALFWPVRVRFMMIPQTSRTTATTTRRGRSCGRCWV